MALRKRIKEAALQLLMEALKVRNLSCNEADMSIQVTCFSSITVMDLRICKCKPMDTLPSVLLQLHLQTHHCPHVEYTTAPFCVFFVLFCEPVQQKWLVHLSNCRPAPPPRVGPYTCDLSWWNTINYWLIWTCGMKCLMSSCIFCFMHGMYQAQV